MHIKKMSRYNELCCVLRDIDHTTGVIKKKTLDLLKDVLNDCGTIDILHKNSATSKTDTITWNSIFNVVHTSLLKVEDNRRRKETSALVNLSLQCSSLLSFIVKKASHEHPRINSSNVVRCFIEVANIKYLTQNVGGIYLEILKVILISHRKSRSDLSSELWKDLLISTSKLYNTSSSHLEVSLIVEILNLVVLHGYCQSDLNNLSKNLYPLIKTTIQDNQFSRSKCLYQERLLQLLVTLCAQTAQESRTALCHFGEEVICPLICMYDKFSGKGKNLLHDFLLIQLHAHHPGGAQKGAKCCYAFDWKQWNTCLDSVYSLILAEIECFDRKSKTISTVFLRLAVEVFKQVVGCERVHLEQGNNDDECSSRKRRKLEKGIMALIIPIQSTSTIPTNLWFLLSILGAAIDKYPDLLKQEEFIPFLEFIADLQSKIEASQNNILMERICICCVALLKAEKYVKLLDINVINSLWLKIWVTTMRCVGWNQRENEIQFLLQALIKHDKAKNLPELTKCFVDSTFQVCTSSVQTLSVLLNKYDLSGLSYSGVLSSSNKTLRNSLLEWILSENNYSVPPLILAETVLQLASKTSCNKNFCINAPSHSVLDLVLQKIDQDYMISSFVKKENISDMYSRPRNIVVNLATWSYIEQLLVSRISSMNLSQISNEVTVMYLKEVFHNLMLLLEIWAAFHDKITTPPLFLGTMDNLIKFVARHIEYFLKDIENYSGCLCEVIEYYHSLVLNNYPSAVCQWFCDSAFMQIVKCVSSLVISEYNTPHDNDLLGMDTLSSRRNEILCEDNVSSLLDECFKIAYEHYPQVNCKHTTEEGKLRLHCMKFLGCMFKIGMGRISSINSKANDVLNSVPLVDLYAFNGVSWIIQALLDNEEMDPTVILSVLRQLKSLFITWFNDSETTLAILRLLEGLVQHIHKTGAEKNNFIVVINGIYKCILKNKFGVKVSVAFIKCLETVTKVDPSASWSTVEGKPIAENVLSFLGSPSYEVRLAAAMSLKTLFAATTGKMDSSWHTKLFSCLCEIINTSFIIEADLGECVNIDDEAANRSASALHAFLAIIISSPILYKQALFGLLKFCEEKNVDIELFKGALSYLGAINGIDPLAFLVRNVSFLVREWLENQFQLQDLAKYIYQPSPVVFYEKYLETVVPILLLRGDTVALKAVSNLVNRNIMQILEDSFPQIMGELLPGLQEENNLAKQYEKQLQHIISKNHMDSLLLSKLPQIVVALFKKIHDPIHFTDVIKVDVSLSPPDISNISLDTAKKCMQHLQLFIEPETNLLEYLTRSPSHIQMILLDLSADIYEAVLLHDKLTSFYHYSMFASILATDVSKQESSVLPYSLCSIVHTLTHLVKNSHDSEVTVAVAACYFLKHFCKLCLPQNVDILSKLVVLMTDTLVSAVKSSENLQCAALSVLKFIFVENCKHFSEAILLVDTLPTDSVFKEMQIVINNLKKRKTAPSLEEEISGFLQMRYLTGKHGIECLKCLLHELSLRKKELKQMYDRLLASRGFSDECSNSLLHRLICRLLELTASSEKEVSIHAGYCLGEIGPSDLGTLVLKTDAVNSVTDVVDMVPLVAECLLDENINVVKYASHAMFSLLDYKESRMFAEKNLFLSFGVKLIDFLYPFIVDRKCHSLTFVEINKTLSISQISNEYLWCPMQSSDHNEWLINLAVVLLNSISEGNNFISELIPLCKVKASFTELIFPFFVAKLLNQDSQFEDIIVQNIEMFFKKHVVFSKTSDPVSNICLNKASVQCMLNLVHFLRTHHYLKNNQWNPVQFELNYLNIAQAAQFCNAHFSSILYVELWCDKWLKSKTVSEEQEQSQTVLERIYEEDPENGSIAQKILWDAYLKMCDLDAIYGCGSSLLLDPNKRTLHYELHGQWDKAILSYDVQLSTGHSESSRGMVYALQNAGFQHVLDMYLRSAPDIHYSDLQYECAWRLGKWDAQIVDPYDQQGNFELNHFLALRALYDNDKVGVREALFEAHKCVSQSLVNISLESCKSIYKTLSQFQQIREINEFSLLNNEQEMNNVLKKWSLRDSIAYNQFEDIEPIFWQRLTMLNASTENSMKQKAVEIAAKLAGIAREENCLQVTAKCIGSFNSSDVFTNVSALLKKEEACLAWNSGDYSLGKRIMRELINNLGLQNHDKQSFVIHAQSLKLYGDWLVETKSENPQVVIDKYYLRALKYLEDTGSNVNESILDIYSTLAHFADGQYQNLSNYFKSRSYEVKKQWIDRAAQDVENLRKQQNRTKDDDRAIVLKHKQSKIDKEEITNTASQKDKYLDEAMKYYLKCLEFGDRNNLDVFRVASLWLENMLHPSLKIVLDEHLFKVPTYKFVPVLPQLTPRISNVKDNFTIKLNKLLVRCAEDHPHHTLPIILALANACKDREYSEGSKSNQSRIAEPRELGAQKLIHSLFKESKVGVLLQKMNEVYSALISIAYAKSQHKERDHTIQENQPLMKLKNVESVLVPTLTMDVDRSCKYTNVVGIIKYEPSYSLVGGINAPKKLICLGTDGVKRIQLVKGQDDLRQDAVMQQVFTIMNSFLRKNKDTLKRKLLIRTYKVLPLSQRSGVIEWCVNTIPLLIYLTGPKHCTGAHKKYYPNDKATSNGRDMMKVVSMKSAEEKLATYKKICSVIHPVLRYFFLEHFTSPGMWFERRQAYIHSVATSSMIGYILGLGDRHLMNILIDEITAEVIHIDFGIAFEMGHVLPTPETVPFRLTRDIVDGMGVSGVEGVFQKSCEKTMSVLRENQTILLTVLEVLLYDPLYAWTITPSKAYKLQRKDVNIVDETDSFEVNRMAERALQRLKQKLVGTEVGAGVSVPIQVSRLIQEACDPGNLSRLYFGWEPYL